MHLIGKTILWMALLSLQGGACGRNGAGRPPPEAHGAAKPSASFEARLGIDGTEQQVNVYQSQDLRLGFFTVGRGEQMWTSPVYPMWKALPADLDGDGRDEVVAGIWSTKKRHDEPQPHRTVWVLGGSGRGLEELWRGSSLARPLDDFAVADLDNDRAAELLSLEHAGGKCFLTAYRWTGFGFVGAGKRVVRCGSVFSGDTTGCIELDGRESCPKLGEKGLEMP